MKIKNVRKLGAVLFCISLFVPAYVSTPRNGADGVWAARLFQPDPGSYSILGLLKVYFGPESIAIYFTMPYLIIAAVLMTYVLISAIKEMKLNTEFEFRHEGRTFPYIIATLTVISFLVVASLSATTLHLGASVFVCSIFLLTI
jgi:hypothetical protein